MVLLLALALVQEGAQWVEFQSRESDNPPRLVIDGKEHVSTADTVLISYLADRAYGSMKGLAVSRGDTNRALVKFDVEAVEGAKKAELVLELKLPQIPPKEPFELGVHVVTAEWDEKTSWSAQPAIEKEPAAKVMIAPKAGEVRIDVTAAVKKGAKHGFLLKVTAPVGGDPGGGSEVERALRKMIPWAASLAEAQKDGRPVLAFVVSEDDPRGMAISESVMLASFAHPDLLAVVKKGYAPVRVLVDPNGGSPELKALGTTMKEAKPPSLVIWHEGKVVAALASIGTYDVDLFLEFLRKPLKDPPAPSDVLKGVTLMRGGKLAEARGTLEGLDDPQALYWLGCLWWREREPGKAKAAWESVVKKHAASPWALKASVRLAWPERIAVFETLEKAAPVGTTTEVGAKDVLRAMERAADYLMGQQLADGTWPVPEAPEMYQAAVTALVANALFAWGESFTDERKKRAASAVSRATDWMRIYVTKADPAGANAWGSAYLLDYFLARHAANAAFKPSVEKAVALLLGGQLENGAWSYDRKFGMSWKGGFGGWPKTDKGRAHSMNTGPALVALAKAKKAGFEVDAKALEKGKEALLSMRKAPGVFTYVWPGPDSFAKLDQSIGRASGCEHALLLLGAGGGKDADVAIEAFMKWKEDLRIPVKVTPGWIAPRATSSYFYHVAYFDAARLIVERGGKLAALKEDLLAVVEADGTWVDFQNAGKPYATAMAMIVIRAAK